MYGLGHSELQRQLDRPRGLPVVLRPHPAAQPGPPIARLPKPMSVVCISVLPNLRVCTVSVPRDSSRPASEPNRRRGRDAATVSVPEPRTGFIWRIDWLSCRALNQDPVGAVRTARVVRVQASVCFYSRPEQLMGTSRASMRSGTGVPGRRSATPVPGRSASPWLSRTPPRRPQPTVVSRNSTPGRNRSPSGANGRVALRSPRPRRPPSRRERARG